MRRSKGARYVVAVGTKGGAALALFGMHVAFSRLATDPDAYGAFAWVVSAAGVIGILSVWGLDRFLVRVVSLGARIRPGVLVGALIPPVLLSVGVGLGYLRLARPDLEAPLWIAALAATLVGIGTARALAAILRGLDWTVTSEVALQLGRPLLALGAVAGLFAGGRTPIDGATMAAVFGFAWVGTAALLMLLLLVLRRGSDSRTSREGSTRESASRDRSGEDDDAGVESAPAMLRASAPYFAAGLALPMLSNVDVLVLARYLPDAEVALYAAAARIVSLASMGLLAVGLLLSGRIAPLARAGATVELQALLRENMRVTLAVSAPLIAIVVLGGRPLLGLFGEGYEAAYAGLLVLLVGQAVNVATGPVNLVASLSVPQRTIIGAALGSVAALVAVAVLLVPRYGIVGGALSQVIGFALFNLLLWGTVRRQLGVDSSIFGALGRAGKASA